MGIRIFEKLLTLLFDIIAINVAFFATAWLRYASGLFPEARSAVRDPKLIPW